MVEFILLVHYFLVSTLLGGIANGKYQCAKQ